VITGGKNLEALRTEIDSIDSQLVRLFNDRARLVTAVGEWKRANQKPIFDPSREKLILEKVQKFNQGPLPNPIVVKLFSELVTNFRQWELESQELNDLSDHLKWLKNKKIGIIGLGLLGYSMVLRFKKLCPEVQIFGYDIDPENQKETSKNVLLLNSFEDLITTSDILILGTPALVTLDLLKNTQLPWRKPQLILDLASTKQLICENAIHLCNFIGGHPLAGKAVSGAQFADSQIFVQKPFIICPNTETPKHLIDDSQKIISILGGLFFQVTPEFHDTLLALTSHLPQMIATNLAYMSSELYQLMGGPFLHGPAYAEMTRCASSNLKMWEDIIRTNQTNITEMLTKFINQLSDFQTAIKKSEISKEFNQAKEFKASILKK
jgi:prephenate dehydrogenase